MKKITLFLSAMLFSVMSFAATATISFADKAQRTSLSETQQVWEQNGLVVTNDKATSTSNVADYANPARFYKGSSLTIECTLGNITKIEVTCNTAAYATALQTSVGAEATVAEKIVTIVPSAESATYVVEALTAQVRVNELTVTYGEGGEIPENPDPEEPIDPEEPEQPENPEPENPAGTVTFDADVDKGTATETQAEYEVIKDGVTMTVSSGRLGTYNNEVHYRIYKNQTLTLTSTAGNIVKVEFTCTANDDAQYGPGCFTASAGDYNYSGPVGTWTGSASEVVFTAATNQVRATQVVVTLGEGSGDNPGGDDPNPGTGDVVEIAGLQYADAYYYEYEGIKFYDIDLYKDLDEETYDYVYPDLYIVVEANSKTALNGTYDLLYAGLWTSANDSVEIGDELGTVTIQNTDKAGNYSFKGSYMGTDGKTYTFDQVVEVYAYDADADYEDITLNENGGDTPGDNPGDDPITPPADGVVTFDADVDKGNASEDSSNQTPYTVSKGGVTLDVTKGIIGKYNDECHYRVYQNESLTITSTVGNIVSVEFTCTANDDAKYGPGNFAVDGGSYTYSGPVGTWTGGAASVVFTASTAQVRVSQILVTIAEGDTGVEDILVENTPVKVVEKGQLMIICGESVYNVLGVQVK